MGQNSRLNAYLFILPALLVVLAVSLYPVGYAFWLSLTDWYPLRSPSPVFHGLAGYERLFNDRLLWVSLQRTIIWTVGTVAVEFIVGLGVTLLLNRPTRINGMLSGVILLPWVVPSVVVAYTWRWLLDSEFGALHHILQLVGIAGRRSLLSEPDLVLPILIVVSAWKGIPFMVVALLAALRAIPPELYEAASVDGATMWQRFRFITLPLIRSVSIVISLVLGILAFYSFDIVWIMTRGGPSEASTLIGIYLFRNFFERQELSYAATIGMFMLSLLLVFSIFYLWLFGRGQRR